MNIPIDSTTNESDYYDTHNISRILLQPES